MHVIAAAPKAEAWKGAVLAALLAVTVGIGLSRFAYSALIPVMIEARWVTSSEAGYLGAANLIGYLIGAVGGLAGVVQRQARLVLRVSMLFATLAFLASAIPVDFAWLAGWRGIAGVTGGLLMVLAAPMVMPLVPVDRRGVMSGVVFSGIGIGILMSSTVVPLLAPMGPFPAWIVLGVVCLLATALAWPFWPGVAATPEGESAAEHYGWRLQPAVAATAAVYGLAAIGLVPHMVFLVDFVARGLGQGFVAGGLYWSLFGIGALLGPLAAGRLADAVGFGNAVRLALVLQIPLIALPALSSNGLALALTSAGVGAAVPGIVTLTMGRMRELAVHPRQRTFNWSIATIAFAIGQAGGGYLFSLVFAATGEDFALLFLLGAAALAVAGGVSFGVQRKLPASRASRPAE